MSLGTGSWSSVSPQRELPERIRELSACIPEEEKCFLWSFLLTSEVLGGKERPVFRLADGTVLSLFIHVCNLEATGLPGISVFQLRILLQTFSSFSVWGSLAGHEVVDSCSDSRQPSSSVAVPIAMRLKHLMDFHTPLVIRICARGQKETGSGVSFKRLTE